MKREQKLKFLFALCGLLLFASPSWAIYTRARFTGPFKFTACGLAGSPSANVVSSSIRYDSDFMPPGTRNTFTVVLVGVNTPPICKTDPLSVSCLAAFPPAARILIPNPREFRFAAHAGLAGSTFDLMAVSASFRNGQVDIAHTRVEEFTFVPCATTQVPTITGGNGIFTPLGVTTVPGTPNDLVNHPAVAHWAGYAPYDRVATPSEFGVVADHPSGIERVEFQLNGGPPVSVTTPTNERAHAQNGYFVRIDPAPFPPGTLLELRARVFPRQGRTVELAGPITDASVTTGFYSLFLRADNNSSLPRATVHLAPNGSDTNGTGTMASPFATFARAAQHLRGVLGNKLSGGTISLAAGEYQFASGTPDWSNASYTPDGYLTIRSNPGLDADQVRFTSPNSNLNYIPVRLKLENLTFAPPFDGEIMHDHRTPRVAMVVTNGVDYVSPGDLSRHGQLGSGILFKGEIRSYFQGGRRGTDESAFAIEDYQYQGSGITYNDTLYVHACRTENLDQSRLDYPGTPPPLLNHGDVYHVYGRNHNLYVSELVARVDIKQAQGLFVSRPKIGLVVKNSIVDLTGQEKYQFTPGSAAPISGNQMAYIKNTMFNGASNVFTFAAALGGQFVAENLRVPYYPCQTKFNQDCPSLSSGVIYRASSGARMGGSEPSDHPNVSAPKVRPGSPSVIARRQLVQLFGTFPPEVAKMLKERLAMRKVSKKPSSRRAIKGVRIRG